MFGSDARSPEDMEHMEIGIRTARSAWITRDQGRTQLPVRRKRSLG